MYKVTSNGNIVALCESSPYVKVVDGISKRCSIKEATGIVAGGNCYNLVGFDAFPGRPTAWVTESDGWEIVFDDNGKISITMVDVADLQDVACDIDANMEEMMEALCDLDEGRE